MQDDTAPLRLPEGSCDCHFHIYGPFDRFPQQQEGRFTPSQVFSVEDAFAMWERTGATRGVIVHAGQACFGVAPDAREADLCFLAAPAASRRESVACQVWRDIALPLITDDDGVPELEGQAATVPLDDYGSLAVRAVASAKTTTGGWGADDPDSDVAANPQNATASAAAPLAALDAPRATTYSQPTAQVGGWDNEGPSHDARPIAGPALVATGGGGARIVHEALTRWA